MTPMGATAHASNVPTRFPFLSVCTAAVVARGRGGEFTYLAEELEG